MYGGSYPHAKFTLSAKQMQRSKEKSCGYYWRIIFLFSSLIQSLIIVSLVLFMVYGHPEQSSEEKRVQDLQESFMKLTADNKQLQQVKSNLTRILNTTLTQKRKDEQDLQKLRRLAIESFNTIVNLTAKLNSCEMAKINLQKTTCPTCHSSGFNIPQGSEYCNTRIAQERTKYQHLQTNFTLTAKGLSQELDTANQARESLMLESIALRRNATDLQRQLDAYTKKCKSDFAQALEGIQTVTRAFLSRIEGLYPDLMHFQLTCEKQKEQLMEIRANCSSLSREVENKFQSYLDRVVTQVSQIQHQSSKLEARNARLQEDWDWCKQNRTAEASQCQRRSQEAQLKFDQEVEHLLAVKKKLTNENDLRRQTIDVKNIEISQLTHQLNTSCKNSISKTPFQRPPVTYPFPIIPKFPSPPKPGGPGSNVFGTTSDLQKHLKELQEVMKSSGVSG